MLCLIAGILGVVGCDTGVFTDGDGNVYTTIRLGTQVWTVENLRTTSYICGTPIPFVENSDEWTGLGTPALCFYENTKNQDTIEKYGALYNWYVLAPENPLKIAPKGWRVPTDKDWNILETFLSENGYNWDRSFSGNKVAKAIAAQTDWNESDVNGAIGNSDGRNNRSRFSAYPGGYRFDNGLFYHLGNRTYWWTATEYIISHAFNRNIDHNFDDLSRLSDSKRLGFSVRLVSDVQ